MKLLFTKYLPLLIIFFLIINFFSPPLTQAQGSKDAARLLKIANNYFEVNDYETAIKAYRDLLLIDNSLEAKLRLAQAYRLTKNYKKTEHWYKQLVSLEPDEPSHQLHYARVLQSNGKTKEAKKYFLKYAKYDKLGQTLATGCDLEKTLARNKGEYSTEVLSINSPASDFAPSFYNNGIIFCSNRAEIGKSSSKRRTSSSSLIDIFYTEKQIGNQYTAPKKLKGDVNSKLNEGPLSISTDGSMMFFTRNQYYKGKKQKSEAGVIKLALFEATLNEEKWDNITPFQHNNRELSIQHPSLSPDGNTLYFSSDMAGGQGGFDIYMCTKIDTFWSSPINLGQSVNTIGDEVFPYIHDSGTLYFSSNGLAGLGGLDIFSTQKAGTQFTVPKNLGSPFNSARDDFGIVLNNSKTRGYLSSDREGGFGNDDIFSITSKNAVAEYANSGLQFEQPPLANDLINKNVGLSKIAFSPGTWTMLEGVNLELNKVGDYMQQYPELVIEVAAHTDARADDFASLEISQQRANVVREYLIRNKKIAPQRLVARGRGEQQLLNSCGNGVECNEADHERNNRVEIKVLSINGNIPLIKKPINRPTPQYTPSQPQIITNPPPAPVLNPVTTPIKQPLNQNVFSPKTQTLTTPNTGFENNADLNYKVYIGPFKRVDNDTYYTYAELNTPIDIQYSDKGMNIVLGPYNSIPEAESYKQFAQKKGAKKRQTRIVVFQGGEQTELKVKNLKKAAGR